MLQCDVGGLRAFGVDYVRDYVRLFRFDYVRIMCEVFASSCSVMHCAVSYHAVPSTLCNNAHMLIMRDIETP